MRGVRVLGDEILITACEAEPSCATSVFYDLRGDFEVESISAHFSDGFGPTHKRLEQEGKITHSVENCPERFPRKPVREWRDGSWHTLQLTTELTRR